MIAPWPLLIDHGYKPLALILMRWLQLHCGGVLDCIITASAGIPDVSENLLETLFGCVVILVASHMCKCSHGQVLTVGLHATQ